MEYRTLKGRDGAALGPVARACARARARVAGLDAPARVRRVAVADVLRHRRHLPLLLLLVPRHVAQARVMRDARGLARNEAAHEGQLDALGHDVRRALDVALLHQQLEVRHALVLQLLEPLVELHMVLVRARVVVLAPARLAPECLRQLQRALHLAVEHAVLLGRAPVELDGEHAGLDAQLEDCAPGAVGGPERALGALVPAGRAARDVPELGPRQVVVHGMRLACG